MSPTVNMIRFSFKFSVFKKLKIITDFISFVSLCVYMYASEIMIHCPKKPADL